LNFRHIFRERVALYRFIRFRHRYFFTRQNKLRLRYLAASLALVAVMFSGLFGSIDSSVAHTRVFSNSEVSVVSAGEEVAETVVALLPHSAPVLTDLKQEDFYIPADPIDEVVDLSLSELSDDIDGDVREAQVHFPVEEVFPREEVLKMNTGDTLAGILQNTGVSGADAYKVVKAVGKHYDPRSIKAGQAVQVVIDLGENGVELSSLHMKLSATKSLAVRRGAKGRYISDIEKKKVELRLSAAKTVIDSSLYASAARSGIPASIVAEMIRIYSYEIDFQRDIREGDVVEILYEIYETEDGDFARYGDVLFANLIVSGEEMPVYRSEAYKKSGDYFHEDGRSMKRTLMQTPVDGARMSSGYGMRRHPVLGYNKMHKGIDFAAPRGTPIYAAGDGVVEKAGRLGGYGNYLRIRHNSSLKTAYAHLQKFAKGVKKGKRVKQGDVIGYIGSTGRSTGPHLHFEVLKNGKQVNPKSIKSSSGRKLSGKHLATFKANIANMHKKYVALSADLDLARQDLN